MRIYRDLNYHWLVAPRYEENLPVGNSWGSPKAAASRVPASFQTTRAEGSSLLQPALQPVLQNIRTLVLMDDLSQETYLCCQ